MTQPQRFSRGRGVAEVAAGSSTLTGAVASGLGASSNIGAGQLGGQNLAKFWSGFIELDLVPFFPCASALKLGLISAPREMAIIAIVNDVLGICIFPFVVTCEFAAFRSIDILRQSHAETPR